MVALPVVIPVWDQTLPTLIGCLDATVRRFGGVPTYGVDRQSAHREDRSRRRHRGAASADRPGALPKIIRRIRAAPTPPVPRARSAVGRLHHAHVVITEGTLLRVQDAAVGRGVMP